jgi:hypothetical protein
VKEPFRLPSGVDRPDSTKKIQAITKASRPQTTRPFSFLTGGNSQENFTKNLCWRRIGLTRSEEEDYN